RRALSPPRPPLRVDAAGVSRMGGQHRRPRRLHGAVPSRGAGRRKAGATDADGDLQSERLGSVRGSPEAPPGSPGTTRSLPVGNGRGQSVRRIERNSDSSQRKQVPRKTSISFWQESPVMSTISLSSEVFQLAGTRTGGSMWSSTIRAIRVTRRL